MKRVFNVTNLIIMIILSVFLSKSIFNLLTVLLLIISIKEAIKNRNINKEKIFYFYFGIIIIGLISNLYNKGFEGIGNFLSNERHLLYILVFIFLNLRLEEYEKIKNWILIGGILGAFYSTISFFTPKFFGMNTLYYDYYKINKMQSFQPGIRWGRLLQILVPFSYINLEWFKVRFYKVVFILLSIFFVWNIVINGQRAAILGALMSMLIFSFMYIFSLKKNKIGTIISVLIITFFVGFSISNSNKMIKERVESIFDFNENISNKIRMGYWKIGLDMLKEGNYFGVGSGEIGDGRIIGSKFEIFISKKPKEYIEKYYKYNEGKPFENNYLNLAVENGLIYLIYFLFVQVFILLKIFKKYLVEEEKDKKIKLMIIFSLLIGDRIFIFFYPDTDSYVEFLSIILMFYGLKLAEKKG